MFNSTAVAANAARLIQQWINDGTYPAGSLLPSQRELSERLGISRTSLREAFSTLQGLGLIVPRPGKGVYVAENPSPSAQPWRFADSHSLTDIYQLRFALENFTARLAALVVEPADIDALRANAEAMQACIEASDFTQAAQLDFDFHMQIIAISGNRAIAEILRNSAEIIQESQRLPFYKRGARRATFNEHTAIIDALAAGDPSLAQRAMAEHIVQAAQRAGVHFPTSLDGR
ncbi:FadR family transcriptional regulator [Cupriavidus gilardii]|uniref:FadR/GntR family transcriptional regulator n=1 Tax=Cupriavidus gilardii TaxID=82541 RepID=UPI0015801EDC|nr:FadR/GntR family transcriptional regulator [Cupriavidus gilardii]MCT9074209.1 FadR family transcriptional regulator [Cupriavidus gilardii]MCT9119049.1 FadR family transcriptional regulator [Cupriavidus gilardii]QKS60638.1 FadR family transcriptional regulator [Cupriavidus gilardii]